METDNKTLPVLSDVLTNGSSYLVKIGGTVDAIKLKADHLKTRLGVLPPDNPLRQHLDHQTEILGSRHRSIVLALRKEISKYCPKYRFALPFGELDWTTDCRSGQVGEDGCTSPILRPDRACSRCCFFIGVMPEPTVQDVATASTVEIQG